MRHRLVAGFAALVLVAGAMLTAQQPPEGSQPAETTAFTGCLKAGTNAGEFVLAVDEQQQYRIEAAEGVDLSAHANHRVELTGTLDKSATEPVLKATALKMVATSCEGL